MSNGSAPPCDIPSPVEVVACNLRVDNVGRMSQLADTNRCGLTTPSAELAVKEDGDLRKLALSHAPRQCIRKPCDAVFLKQDGARGTAEVR
jgi:hypothetical protein